MKTVYFQNYRNNEKFECHNLHDVKIIDGIEFLKVFKFGTSRDCFVRKDQLKKIQLNKQN